MKGILSAVALFCFINLVPYILSIFLLILSTESTLFSIINAIKSLLEIPTSFIWFIIQKDLGDIWWIILNILGLGTAAYLIKEL